MALYSYRSATVSTIEFARQMRMDVLSQIHDAGRATPGEACSCVDLLACIFATRIDPVALLADRPDRNHFILSKGHAAPSLYAALARHRCDPPRRTEWVTAARFPAPGTSRSKSVALR